MKKYKTVGPNWVECVYTEYEILQLYGKHWFTGMIERRKPIEMITAQNCIDDWVVVNWAVEII